MNAIAFPVQQEQHRVYKRAGCFNLTAVIAVPAHYNGASPFVCIVAFHAV